MKQQKDFHIGPGAASLILIVVVLSMSILGTLALLSARHDERLSVRSAAVAQAIGELHSQGERSIAEIDGIIVQTRSHSADNDAFFSALTSVLPEYCELSGNRISWTESDEEGRILYCTIEISDFESAVRYKWLEHRVGSEFNSLEIEDTWD